MRQFGGLALALSALVGMVGCSADDGGPSGSRAGSGNTGVGAAGVAGAAGLAQAGTAGAAGAAGAAGFGNQPINPTAGTPAVVEPTPQGEGCAGADVSTSRVVPTVLFVVDGSGSMDQNFNGPRRWDALRDALMGDGGIIPTLEGSVEFGMVMYHGPRDNQDLVSQLLGVAPTGVCPDIRIIDPALNNFSVIDQNYPADPLGGSTPTHTALDFVMNNLADTDQVSLDADLGPQYVVLATDGQPNDGCVSGTMTSTMPQVVTAAELGASKGVKMFVISLAPADNEFQAHLDQLAQIGNTGYGAFSPQTKDELQNVLIQVIGGAVGCQISLNGTVTPGNECLGYVDFNGHRLECGSDNGWRLIDERTFELTGQACADFLASPDALLHADFPCDVFIPQ